VDLVAVMGAIQVIYTIITIMRSEGSHPYLKINKKINLKIIIEEELIRKCYEYV